MSRRGRFYDDKQAYREKLLERALLESIVKTKKVELRPIEDVPPLEQPFSKVERVAYEMFLSIQDVLTEPLVLVSFVFSLAIFILSEESHVIAYIVDFLGTYNVPGKLTKYVPRIIHYLFSIVPLFSLEGKRRWLALSLSAAICFFLKTEAFVVYATLGVSVRLIFGAGTLQTGTLLLFVVVGLLILFNPVPPGVAVNRNKRSTEDNVFPLIPSEEINDTLVPS